MRFEIYSFTLPAYAICPIFNGDYSGVTDAEEKSIIEFERDIIARYGAGHFSMPEEMNFPEFRRYNDLDSYAGDCYDIDYCARRGD